MLVYPAPAPGEIIEPDGNVTQGESPIADHAATAVDRTIERWKDKAAFQALLKSYADEAQELEDALWELLRAKFPDYAEGVALEILGKIVGVEREGRSDARLRARVRVQIAINQSLGRPRDVVNVLRILDAGSFTLEETPPAAFRIVYSTPPVPGFEFELGPIVKAAKAVGVGASVTLAVEPGAETLGLFTFDDEAAYPSVAPYGWSDIAGEAAVGGALWDYVKA